MNEDKPTPGPTEPVPSWPEYRQLREAIHDYLDHEPDDPTWSDIWRAFGAILGEYQRDAFTRSFGVEQAADRACIRRLITGENKCTCRESRDWQDRELETIGARDDPPHAPPHADHKTLWLDEEGEPVVYGMHLYPGNVEAVVPSKTADPDQQRRNGWFDIFTWAAEWGLEVGILPVSWYNPGSTVHAIFYPPERFR